MFYGLKTINTTPQAIHQARSCAYFRFITRSLFNERISPHNFYSFFFFFFVAVCLLILRFDYNENIFIIHIIFLSFFFNFLFIDDGIPIIFLYYLCFIENVFFCVFKGFFIRGCIILLH